MWDEKTKSEFPQKPFDGYTGDYQGDYARSEGRDLLFHPPSV